jgi:hypothetical protein
MNIGWSLNVVDGDPQLADLGVLVELLDDGVGGEVSDQRDLVDQRVLRRSSLAPPLWGSGG